MKKPVLLFRNYSWNKEEREIASQYFDITNSRVNLSDRLVIGRFSVLPFYNELQNDFKLQNSQLVNSLLEHQYIANFDYYEDIRKYTFKTYFDITKIPDNTELFIKGRTNSKKHLGFNKTRASNKKEAIDIYFKLLEDPEFEQQGIIFREFENLMVHEKSSISEHHFYHEWRFFFYQGNLLDYGYYWVNAENILNKDKLSQDGLDFAYKISEIVKDFTNFYVIDIGLTQNGEWRVIELNDGQQSGLSGCDPQVVYSNLKKALDKNEK
jgi:hypothetical protein